MKMRLLKLEPAFLLKILQGKKESIISNLPSDVELIEIKYDLFSSKVLVVVRSDNFEDLADSYPIPEFNLKFTQSIKKPAIITTAPKSEVKIKREKKVTVNQDILAYQKEFSPEQRKLLRFKIDGDYLIVKPATYLKKEWNEINEVAKNIGGEWVKGSIISYWKIPIQ
jgi:hypothetical protein